MMAKCKKLFVAKDVCYLSFAKQKKTASRSEIVGYTLRDEQIVLDYDAEGGVIGIELVAPDLKPCQGVSK